MTMRKTADQWFDEYGESHQNPTNKLLHWICVPSITASLTGLIWGIPVPAAFENMPMLNWATLLIAIGMIFYVRLSLTLAIGMLLFQAAVVGTIILLERQGYSIWRIAIGVFVMAWIGQFLGHKIEGKKPSFFQDLQFLLIGPAWLLGFIFRKFGIPY